MPAEWVMQVSIVPRLVAISIDNEAGMLRDLRDSGTLTLSLLTDDQSGSEFNSHSVDATSFELGEHTGCPILKDAAGWLECRVRMTVPVGDHTLVVSRIIDGGLRRDGHGDGT